MGWNNDYTLLTAPISLGDISRATGVGGPPYDLGYMIKNGTAINIYAKYKPVKWGSVTPPRDVDLEQLDYGISVNESIDMSKSFQNPYWTYNRPTAGAPNEWFRALDFHRYKANAECPLLYTGNIYYDVSGSIHIDMSTILNRSQNVEIPIARMHEYAEQDYVGIVLWDTTRKYGYYLITDTYFEDVLNNTMGNTWHDGYKYVYDLPFNDGDVIEFFWATSPVNTMVHDQEGDYPAFMRVSASSIISLLACDSDRGHMTFTILKLNPAEDLGFINRNTIISGAWNTNRTRWTFNQFGTDIQCTYTWPRSTTGESYPFTWWLRDNDGTIFTRNANLSSANASNFYSLSLHNGTGRSWSIQELIDMDYKFTFDLMGKLTDSSESIRFATITYDVNTGTWTWS